MQDVGSHRKYVNRKSTSELFSSMESFTSITLLCEMTLHKKGRSAGDEGKQKELLQKDSLDDPAIGLPPGLESEVVHYFLLLL